MASFLAGGAASSTDNSSVTVTIDSTGANLLVVAISVYNSANVSIADSKGNTWTATTNYANGLTDSRLFYCLNPTVGTGHGFTINQINCYPAIAVAAFSGANGFEAGSGSGASATTIQPGSLTPAENGAIIVTGVSGLANPASFAVNSGFTAYTVNHTSHSEACGIAYLIQGTAGAVNPTWTAANSSNIACGMLVFSPASAVFSRTGSGGIVAGGTAPGSLGFATTPAGGLTIGGAGTPDWTVVATAAGDLQLGGKAASGTAFPITASGGLNLGGTAPGSFRYAAPSSGGWTLGGSGLPTVAFGGTAAGGLSLGGSAAGLPAFSLAPTGGLALAGSARPAGAFVVVASGGWTLGGIASTVYVDGRPCYHIYTGNTSGGPVDYTTIVGTTFSTTWTSPALAPGSSQRFALRMFDPLAGLDDGNLDATVTVRLDGSANDASHTPFAPATLIAKPGTLGTATATWSFLQPPGSVPPPAGFSVWLTAGSTVDTTASPAATVTYVAGQTTYTATLSGLTGGTTYAIGVRARSATGTESNTIAAQVVGVTAGPSSPDGATGTGL